MAKYGDQSFLRIFSAIKGLFSQLLMCTLCVHWPALKYDGNSVIFKVSVFLFLKVLTKTFKTATPTAKHKWKKAL